MNAATGLAGRWPPVSRALFFLLTAFLSVDDSHSVASYGVSRNAASVGASQAAQEPGAGLSLRRRLRPVSHMPQTLQVSPKQPYVLSETVYGENDSPRLVDTTPLAFAGQLEASQRLSSISRPGAASPVSATAAPAVAETKPTDASSSIGDGGLRGGLGPHPLAGRYCCSVRNTLRLPTRTVVIGGGPAGAEAFDLLHVKPLAVQQQLLQEKLAPTLEGAEGPLKTRGPVFIGSLHRVAVQTMANSDTKDVDATVQQVLRCAAAGADMVRLTVQGPREADASQAIVERLRELGCAVPLVADIHFQPRVASLCSEIFDKVRINPGNFADGRKVWEEAESPKRTQQATTSLDVEESGDGLLTPDKVGSVLGPWGSVEGLFSLLPPGERQAFCDGHRRIEEVFLPLVEKCLQRKKAMRIGTNHGSLSARILRHFGDTPMGMVLSAVEFADICVRAGFYNFVFSLKSSNPATMLQAYRLMAHLMAARGAHFPLHLGVTEAGEGEDGRIKSAAGIGALLQDGIGDTIRASLTEPPWDELPVCRFLRHVQQHKIYQGHLQTKQPTSAVPPIPPFEETSRDFAAIEPRRDLRLGRHPGSPTALPGKPSEDTQTILHRDGTAVVAIDAHELLNPASLYAALGLRVVGGVPFRSLLSADAVYLRSLFFPRTPEPEWQQPQRQHRRQAEKEGETPAATARDNQLLAARRCLLELQRAGLTVWADALEIQQVQMAREQLLQHLLQQQATPPQQRQMLQELEGASLYIPGLVAVQRLQDAAAVGSSLAMEYLKATAGLALVADGTETLEEFEAVVGRPSLLCILVRPADRAATGVAAARRISELLRQAERKQAEGLETTTGSVPIIQWIEAPPSALLPTAAGDQRQHLEKVNEALPDSQAMSMFAAWEAGSLLLDRLADGVLLDAPRILSTGQQRQLALDLLQGCRMRSTKTEFISCPSCGRTLFDIQKVSAEIRRRTGHLPGVKIAVMGCIVNGIGEMGDADFGYVGGAPGLVDLYVGKKLVRRGVKGAEACDALIDVIKAEGRWKEPDELDVAS